MHRRRYRRPCRRPHPRHRRLRLLPPARRRTAARSSFPNANNKKCSKHSSGITLGTPTGRFESNERMTDGGDYEVCSYEKRDDNKTHLTQVHIKPEQKPRDATRTKKGRSEKKTEKNARTSAYTQVRTRRETRARTTNKIHKNMRRANHAHNTR